MRLKALNWHHIPDSDDHVADIGKIGKALIRGRIENKGKFGFEIVVFGECNEKWYETWEAADEAANELFLSLICALFDTITEDIKI